jgi:hypothetical protein
MALSPLLIGFQKLRLCAMASLWYIMFLLHLFLPDIQFRLDLRDSWGGIAVCDEDGTNQFPALSVFRLCQHSRNFPFFVEFGRISDAIWIDLVAHCSLSERFSLEITINVMVNQ